MIFPILPDGWGLLKAYQEKQNGWIYHPDLRGNDTQKAGHMFVWYFRRYSLIILHFGTNMCTAERGRPAPFPKITGQKGNANENRRTGYHQGCRTQCTGGGGFRRKLKFATEYRGTEK